MLLQAGSCQRPVSTHANRSSHNAALDWQIKITIITRTPTINKQKEHTEPWETH